MAQLIPTQPRRRSTYVWSGGRLHPLPMNAKAMVGSRLISWPGKLRMGAEMMIPAQTVEQDESLASFVRRRFGREVLDKLAAPLMVGVYSADPAKLSIKSTFPMLPAMEKRYGSVLRGFLQHKLTRSTAAAGEGAMFLTLRGCMQELVAPVPFDARREPRAAAADRGVWGPDATPDSDGR